MINEPRSTLIDQPLSIESAVLQKLLAFRHADKFDGLPGTDTADEKARLSEVLNDLTDSLLKDVEEHPSTFWVLTEFQKAWTLIEEEDTEARDQVWMAMRKMVDILGIEITDIQFATYLGGE